MLISEKPNLVELLYQRLLTLHPGKYNQFLSMMREYSPFREENVSYFKSGSRTAWNKTPQEKITQIIELFNQGRKAKDIASEIEVSLIKVYRVLKENNLGKRIVKTQPEKQKEIALFVQQHKELTLEDIGKRFGLSISAVIRACKRFGFRRGNKGRYKIPEEKVQRIIQIYREKPTVKISEVSKEVGVSDTVVRRVRKQYGLTHLGYMHLIGNNNKRKNEPLYKMKTEAL